MAYFLAAACVHAAEPASKTEAPLEPRIAALIEALNADTLKARTAAEKELMSLGPAALPHLPPPDLLPTASVREAVRRVRLDLERRKATESLKPSLVTLDAVPTVAALLKELEKQTGNKVNATRIPPEILQRTVAVGFDKTPYWVALDGLAEQVGLKLVGGNELALEPLAEGESNTPLVDHAGAFRVAVSSANLRPLLGQPGKQLLRVRGSLAVEPRLRPLFAHYASREVTAVADDSTMLPSFTPDAKYELPMGSGTSWLDLSFDYVVPAEAPPKSVRLSGLFKLLTAAGSEEFAFGDLEKAKSVARRRGGVTVTLREATFLPEDAGQKARVKMTVVYDTGGPAFESHRSWIFYNDCWLQRPGGPRVPRDPGFAISQQTDGGVALEFEFFGLDPKPSDYRFHYVAPTLLLDVPVRFTLPAIAVSQPKSGNP